MGVAGNGTSDQAPLLYCSVKDATVWLPVSPLAMQKPVPAHDTSKNSGEVEPAGAGVGMTDHVDPFHCSARTWTTGVS